MLITDKFSSNTIEEIAKILGETLTGGEIARFLRESNITEYDQVAQVKCQFSWKSDFLTKCLGYLQLY